MLVQLERGPLIDTIARVPEQTHYNSLAHGRARPTRGPDAHVDMTEVEIRGLHVFVSVRKPSTSALATILLWQWNPLQASSTLWK